MNYLHHYDPDDPYPESDGLPMAENTEQYDWLVKIKENLEILFANRTDVFIAGDLFWYPVPERKVIYPVAPDVMVVFGRPKGRRGSYRQWEEAGIAPQVVFEILSPSNTTLEMENKKRFYDQQGVQEYYVYDPDCNRLEVWIRNSKHLRKMTHLRGWISPLLGIRFALDQATLQIFYPSGRPFLNSVELNQHAETALLDKEAERREKEAALLDKEAALLDKEAERREKEAALLDKEAERREKETALLDKEAERREKEAALLDKEAALLDKEAERREKEVERQRANAAEYRAHRLEEQLRALGINPET